MMSHFDKWKIKAIIWDFDGVLANINHAYYCFIKNHPKFKKHFKNFQYKDLNKALPIDKNYGAIELKTHKKLGKMLDKYFCSSRKYYFDRPLYYGTENVLQILHNKGYKQFILSAGFDTKKKLKLISQTMKNLPFVEIFTVKHIQKKDNKTIKQNAILELLQEKNLKKNETVLIDDRIYNIYSALNAGIRAIRFRSEFTTDSPKDLKKIPEIYDIKEFLSKT